MKRYGNIYDKICSMENLELAYKNAKKGKGWYREVREIEENPQYWYDSYNEFCFIKDFVHHDHIRYLCGNKIDLKDTRKEDREIFKKMKQKP